MSFANERLADEKPLRVAIVGYGLAGAVFHAPLIESTPGMTVAAIVTSDPGRRMQALRDFPRVTLYASVEELWRDAARYDLVVIATPNRLHVPLGVAALNAGLPVVIDKPMAPSVAEAQELIKAGQKAGKLLTVFHNRRWDTDFRTIRSLLDTDLDLLGPITRFESRFERYRPIPRYDTWREQSDPEDAGGLLYDLGSHLIDQALVLFGKPMQVYAESERRRPGVQVDDDTFVSLRFKGGVYAHLWMSSVSRVSGPRVRISGLRGTYEKWGLDPQEDALRNGMRPGHPDWGKEPREKWGRLSTDISGISINDSPIEMLPGAYEQFYIFLRVALVMGGPPPVDPLEAIETLHVIEAAQESIRKGQVIRLE
ncbi:MAG TPA: Gfo/Idh/MocA family oxidoreductase [Ktedonobacteraceae bacterium]|jgi:scyllo-inositol 2-dehydrogenase (NADP+)|nr:Gfo/Idh/MocA family oxidoreductase [Ktedonobacteraceae bacterium]